MTDSCYRHRRIHEPRADGEVGNFEEDELENEEHEFGNIEEDSPRQEQNYLSSGGISLSMMTNNPGITMSAPSQLIQAQQQMLQGQI